MRIEKVFKIEEVGLREKRKSTIQRAKKRQGQKISRVVT